MITKQQVDKARKEVREKRLEEEAERFLACVYRTVTYDRVYKCLVKSVRSSEPGYEHAFTTGYLIQSKCLFTAAQIVAKSDDRLLLYLFSFTDKEDYKWRYYEDCGEIKLVICTTPLSLSSLPVEKEEKEEENADIYPSAKTITVGQKMSNLWDEICATVTQTIGYAPVERQ